MANETCTIYYNPKCGTCRDALDLIEKKGVKPKIIKIIEYLKTPPTERELEELLKLLGCEPEVIVRTKEPIYQELGLDKEKLSHSEWIKTLVKHPILIQRPIVIKGLSACDLPVRERTQTGAQAGKRAILGRPAEKVLEIL